MSVANFLQAGKGRDIAFVGALIVVAGTGFGLGRLSAQESLAPRVVIETPQENKSIPSDPGSTTIEIQTEKIQAITASAANIAAPSAQKATQQPGGYVAAKTGTTYYLPWCGGVKRIKEENKIWFQTKEEAEKAGYRPAANCKGM